MTRLQTPSPNTAAAIPAVALTAVESTSATAKMAKSRRLATRALATAMLPPIVRISESIANTGARSGRAKMSAIGQDSAHNSRLKLAPILEDIQNTVDSSSDEGFWWRI